MTTCSIIIVNFKAPQLVLDCLGTLLRPAAPPGLEVIVVDNFSQDDSESRIRQAFPEVRWIQMGYNSGFARANNAGMQAAGSDIFLLLNSDTLNENNAIVQCLERFRRSDYVACSVQLLNADRSPHVAKVVDAAGEKLLVGQHTDAACAVPLVYAADLHWIEVGSNQTGRRAGLLDLGNQLDRTGRRECGKKVARGRRRFGGAAQLVFRPGALGVVDLTALCGDDFVEYGHGLPVSRLSQSSLSA